MLLNVAKCQGYSFYRFWVIKKKSQNREKGEGGENGGAGGGVGRGFMKYCSLSNIFLIIPGICLGYGDLVTKFGHRIGKRQ